MRRVFSSALLVFSLLALLPTQGSMQSPSRIPADLAAAATKGPVRVIVRLDPAVVPEAALPDSRAVADQRATITAAQDAALDVLAHAEAVTRFQTLAAFAVTTDAEGLARLANLPNVVSIAPDVRMRPALVQTPEFLGVHPLWFQGSEGVGWSVAVLDTGVEKTHSFLFNRVTSEACYSTTSSGLNATSLCPGGASESIAVGSGLNCGIGGCEHGTRVAGVAAGRGALANGMARGANVISIQIYSRVGATLNSFESDQIRALERVLALAGPSNSGRIGAVLLALELENAPRYAASCDAVNPLYTQAIENLRAVGIPTVVSSGNRSSLTELAFPACISRAISVASVTKIGVMSNFGNRNSLLHLVAPGESILTSTLNDGFASFSGTSLAAAHVAGGWTLLKSRVPEASVDTVLQALRLTGVSTPDPPSGQTFPRIVLDRAAGSLGPAGSPTSVRLSVIGSAITVMWENPFDGTAPTSFQVEIVSATSGATVGIVNTGTSRLFTTTLPNGRYQLRVRTVTSAGAGAASGNVPFVIGQLTTALPPMAPVSLRGDVDGQTVTLSWNLPVESRPVTSYVIDVGTAPGLSNLGSVATGTGAVSVVFSNVNAGVYFVRVRARNAQGDSGPSNEITIAVAGSGCSVPLPPSNLTATVVGSLVTLSWLHPVITGTVSGYVIEVGSAPGLVDILRTTVGPSTITSAVALRGTYFVRVRAQSTCGLTGPSNEVTVVVP